MKIDIKSYDMDGETPDGFDDHTYEDEDEWKDGMREFLEKGGYSYLGHSDTTDSSGFFDGLYIIEKGLEKGHTEYVTVIVDTDVEVYSK